MEEDIKDLKKYISFANKSQNFSHNTDWQWHKELAIKIENLIKGYKELNILLKQQSTDIGYMVLNYISKDKIRAKIEELKQGRKVILNDIDGVEKESIYIPSDKIEVLEELLEE